MDEESKKDEGLPSGIPEEFLRAHELEYNIYIWGRSRFLRWLYHPFWWMFSKAYRFYLFTKLPPEERQRQAEKWAKTFRKSLKYPTIRIEDVVGRDEEIALIQDSILYHVFRDEQVVKAHGKRAPPKVFLLKGASGTGKTFLAKAMMNWAFEEGLRRGIFVRLDTIRASEIKTMWYGMSGANMADRMAQMFAGTSVVLIDEAQQFAHVGMGAATDRPDIGGAHGAEVGVSTAFLNALDTLLERPFRGVVFLCTDTYEHILPTIRRRSYLINLDEGFGDKARLELAQRLCQQYDVRLDPQEILDILGETVRAIGEGILTPDDIVRAFEKVIDRIESDRRKKVIEGVSIPQERPQPTLDDFAEVAKLLKEYKAAELAEAAKEAKQFIYPLERFKDVGGLHKIKNDIINEIRWSLNPELAKQVGYEPPRGFLFHGPPGTGKTLLAKAIAGEFRVPFYLVKGPQLFRKWVGESEKAVRDIFKDAKKNAPSIIFLDELDALGTARGGRIGDSGVSHNVLTTLLTELDGFSPLGKVVFIGCTNRKDLLDPALLSRLTRQFEFPYPETTEEKLEIIEVHLNYIRHILDDNVTAEALLEPFMKYTFSPRVIADAIKQATRERGKEIMACVELLKALEEDDPLKVAEIKRTYVEAFRNIHQAYRPKDVPISDRVAVYRRVAEGMKDPKAYPLRIFHIKQAIEKLMRDESYEELLEMQRIYRESEPVVGKVYGLFVVGKELQRGGIGVIECKVFPAAKGEGEGEVNVYGTVNPSIKESAMIARDFLREFVPDIVNRDISLHLVSPSEGVDIDRLKPSGPSAQMAITVAMFSALTKLPIDQDVCFTGKLDIHGKSGLVGGIHPKRGSAKIDVAAEEGFKKIVIPMLGFKKLKRDFPEYIRLKKKRGLEIIGGDTFWDYAEVAFGKRRHELLEIVRRLSNLQD